MMIQNNALVVDIDITLMTRQATNTVESYNQVTNAVASGSFIIGRKRQYDHDILDYILYVLYLPNAKQPEYK